MLKFATTTAVVFLASLMVTGCDDSPSGNGANAADPMIPIERSGNESGDLSVNLPGFAAKVRVPGEIMTSGTFDINGVSLFPGSKISNVKIGSGDQPFTMTFDAPADPARVAAWFQERFTEKSVKATLNDNSLTGTTSDGEPFSINLAPAADGHSTGTITVGSSKN